MSLITDVKLAVNLNKLPARFSEYEALIEAAEPLFSLKGVRLEEACKNHAQNLMYYDRMFQECRTIEDVIKSKVEQVESEIYQRFNENHQRALNARDISQYIKGDPQYIQAYEILLEVIHIKRQLESIVEALKSFGWSLNNIVKIRIAQLEQSVL